MKRADIIADLQLGTNIKKLREEKRISQEKLAEGICDRTTITKIENGFSKILSFVFVVQICDKLDLTVDEFLNKCLNNSYTINKEIYIDFLFNNNYSDLIDSLKSINYSTLTYKDKSFYNYLIGKINLHTKNLKEAKTHFLLSLDDTINFKCDNSIKALSYYELINNNLIVENNKGLNNLYINNLLNIEIKDVPFIYLLDNSIKDAINQNNIQLAKILLEKELYTINSINKFKYLPLYYENKKELYKDNKKIVQDCLNKLNAIKKVNKK